MRNLLTTIVLGILPLFVFSQDKVSDYISNYQHIAVAEMNRSGIPASITLAQGMFESAYGQSPSAISYNNHFGIKCKKEWTGPYFYKHDDDKDKNGKLIPSCFRAYESADASFQDHTNFLVERKRYAELFTYAQTDYYNWAMGLERCGYATNKMYAERLVEIIERYALNQFDNPQPTNPIFVSSEINPKQPVELAPVATDAFSDITNGTPVVVEALAVKQPVIEMPIVKSTEEPIEEETTTLFVLGSFEEFSTVTATQIPKVNNVNPTKVEQKNVAPTPMSRVNQAIILPTNYQRKAESTQTESAKMDRR